MLVSDDEENIAAPHQFTVTQNVASPSAKVSGNGLSGYLKCQSAKSQNR